MKPGCGLLLLVAFLLLPAVVLADTLFLKNGKSFEGRLISDSGGEVRWKTSYGELTFPKDQVDRIEKGRTAMDEFRERKKAIPPTDYAALLDLARWCGENRLTAQRLEVLRGILKASPDHPGAHREMGEVYRDGKWSKAEGSPPEPRVAAGERIDVPETRASLILPKDWKVEPRKGAVRATGPAPYAVPPVLEIEAGAPEAGEPRAAFPEDGGWAEPAEAATGGLAGHRSRRAVVEAGIGRAEMAVRLSGDGLGLRIRLTCLEMEAGGYLEAFELALRSLKLAAPPLDYVNERYRYAMNYPKGEGWEFAENENQDVVLGHSGDGPTDFAQLSVITGDEGDEATQLKTYSELVRTQIKSMGDVKEDREFSLGGVKGHLVDGTFLDRGVPVRQRMVTVERGKRFHLLICTQHEFGVERTKEIWETVIGSFRFLD